MNSFIPSTNVSIQFSIDDVYSSGVVKVYDETETELVSYTLDGGDIANSEFEYVVGAQYNNTGSNTKGLRLVRLTLIDDTGAEHFQEELYYLLPTTRLVKCQNSLATYMEALLMVPDMIGAEAWSGSTKVDKMASLIQAYSQLSEFRLSRGLFLSNQSFDRAAYANRTFSIVDLDAAEFAKLPERVQKDFMRAQMLQAIYLLGGNPAEKLRNTGVMSHSVGESTTFFLTAQKLNRGIADQAYRCISRYLDNQVVILNG